MCGIVGYAGKRPAIDLLLKGLRLLEYRGYDSTGVAFFQSGKIEIKKSYGKLENIEKLFLESRDALSEITCGIGHTRWATHGKPTTQNAHPHRIGHVVLVHNGIIENYQELRDKILKKGHKPTSETDSELFGYLVLDQMELGQTLTESVRKSFLEIQGSCTVVVLSEREPDVLVGVRNGTPLVAGLDPLGGAILASDAQPILEYTNQVYFLEDGDLVIGTVSGLQFRSLHTGQPIERAMTPVSESFEKRGKQGYPHYMLKEIYEQPAAFVETFNGILDRTQAEPFSLADQPGVNLLMNAKRIIILACGTSWYASLLGKYWIEHWARIPVQAELASEYRYRNPVLEPGTLVIGVSQSGETADTLAVIREMKRRGIPTLALTNVRGSTLSREAGASFFTHAGPETGVAATKSFFTQILVFLLWAGHLGFRRIKDSSLDDFEKLFQETLKLPHLLKELLTEKSPMVIAVKNAARALQHMRGFFFMGRGFSFPIALEGALKLKEIAYLHAEGYAAGELKHGPIAMIDEGMAVIVLAPQDSWREKTISNLEEVKARGAKILAVGAEGDQNLQKLSEVWIPLPSQIDESLLPFLLTPVVQLFSYELALLKGTDIDKPRNLAKSVTVE